MMITNQKRMAAEILSKREGRIVGIHRIWVNPDYLDEVTDAVQKEDVRNLIDDGIIVAKPIVGISRSRARKASQQKSKGRRKGQGSRSGSANSRSPRKQRWMTRIRAQRRALKELRDQGSLTPSQYRHFYLKAKGGSYRSIAHMRSNIELEGIASGGEQ
ncbi:MAG: 50S ribosomal protein L19e [Candidatus Thalassarchaeaceae archaeon]|jgi:large subunit ribosomal protein L19e|nr:50S ribosomal protein L19e [Candidatus Thalassarchaeaceae archaeon]MDP7091702.1 50S ribosomal protein L19e [Candidatus Thalassarchaeaceae archaeon]MDP7256923.1 50S ribosomal protein L19e [Candidatus Thalassarchaeaceae archaeon]MDP7446671.1 50S ribosomal protein L19e [Candidatus Thalassarchaeaceae archaeon]MDP7649204.1 50S ribosomal protein L19e [Candidatus Thalassarchaeaceae archaeon]